jgi:hypothetical protein
MRKLHLLGAISIVAAAVIAPTAQGLAASRSNPTTLSSPTSLSSPTGLVDPNALLPTTSVVALVVDSAHHHLFISTGAPTGSLLVTNESGAVKTTIALAGAGGMTLAGRDLYVAEGGAADIAVVDITTLRVVRRLSTGANSCPTSVALVASRYLTDSLDCSRRSGSVGVIDLSSTTLAPAYVATGPEYNPLVRAVPNSTTALVADVGVSPASVAIVNVSGTPAIVKSAELSNGCDNLQDLAVSPDGRTFVPACGAPYEHDVFNTTDLSQVGSYPTGTYPDAAAFSPNGKEFAGGTGFSYGNVLYVLSTAPGAHVTGVATQFGTPWAIAPQTLGFSSNGTTLFAIAKAWFGNGTYTFRLHAIGLAKTPISFIVSTSPSWAVGTQLEVAGRLTFADGQPHVVQLQVTRRLNGQTTQLPTVTTYLGDNVFTFEDTPAAAGTATYTISYAGDPFHSAGKVTAKVIIKRIDPALSVNDQVALGGHATVTATLVGGSANRTVTITAKLAKGRSVVVASGPVSSLGALTGSYRITSATTFTTSYEGDDRYLPSTATAKASPQVITPAPPTAPSDQATIALENDTGDTVVVRLANIEFPQPTALGLFDQEFTLGPNVVSAPIDYPTSGPTVSSDFLGLTVLNNADFGTSYPDHFFTAGHSYLVRVVHQPYEYTEASGGVPLDWQIIQTS